MNDDLLNYYEQELTFIRQMGAEFSKRYPKIAHRLLLEPDKCEDPHVERIIEAFAFLCARIRKKIDDDFPEITEALFNIIYPHYINPIPSMSVVRFEILKTIPPTGYKIDKNTPIFSKPVGGHPCQFTTSYPITLWPIEVISAGLREPKKMVKGAQQSILIQLRALNNVSFSQFTWERLRFYLNGPGQHVFHLYELLFNNVCHVECEIRDQKGNAIAIPMPEDCIRPVGFEQDEGVIPYPLRSYQGYLLLFEFFCFPEKFLFFDLCGIDKISNYNTDDRLDIWIYLDRLAKPNLLINEDTFCPHAAPIINLFRRVAEPIQVENHKTEYHVIPDIRRPEATEIFSIDRVSSTSTTSPGKMNDFQPFYSLRHHLLGELDEGSQIFWYARRMPSGRKDDDGTEVYLSFTDLNMVPKEPDAETITAFVTCTNRDLPGKLPFGDPSGDFEMEVVAPISKIVCLMKPTPTRRPSMAGALQWRIISHLSLNYMSLIDGGEDALKEILALYDFDNSPVSRQLINGINRVKSEFATKRIGQSFCRGVQVTIEFDEDKYVGTGLYLFACILERFLGNYVSVNSFSQLIARTIQRKEVLKKWQPRSGNRVLL